MEFGKGLGGVFERFLGEDLTANELRVEKSSVREEVLGGVLDFTLGDLTN